jgi:hypothetical protein
MNSLSGLLLFWTITPERLHFGILDPGLSGAGAAQKAKDAIPNAIKFTFVLLKAQ